ncbi:hypothetical protein J4E93_004104 [Alternaria ventricosa]|uniref:uncharacterized protein n=1 Tax=Alternaria ventricosa TaxID=1187951 RepID=UPI0020C30F18|nr:uncharacterized protein J4E93_004104 [Alternaria ventricosa]KAI4647694.1 hypothetical protein J4E93_004104 [Alternaria ventricosa]
MATAKITTIPTEILTSIFEYFVDDHETLENVSKAYPELAPAANTVRNSVRRVLVRGNGAHEACMEFLEELCLAHTPSGNAIGPIRYLDLVFDSRAQFRLENTTQEILNFLPAVQHVTLKINARPFPDSPKQEHIENFVEKTCGAVVDYAKLMNMLNSLRPARKIGLSLIINDCILRASPIIAQQYPNITLREFDVKIYLCQRNTLAALAERLLYATETLTDFTILEDQKSPWDCDWIPVLMPFSGLTALKRLHISSGCWFSDSAMQGRQGFLWKGENVRPSIVHLLPPSLSSLRVDFSGSAAIFAVGDGYRAAFLSSRMTSDEIKMKMRPCWNWIYEIAAADPSQFPCLKKVEVLELKYVVSDRGRVVRCAEPMDWDPPEVLKKAFADRGIELTIQIRGKTEFKSAGPGADVQAT